MFSKMKDMWDFKLQGDGNCSGCDSLSNDISESVTIWRDVY